jgi:hypothetical protein
MLEDPRSGSQSEVEMEEESLFVTNDEPAKTNGLEPTAWP